jgi:hypothetical protein
MKRATLSWPAIPSACRFLPALSLGLLLFITGMKASAQDEAAEPSPPSADSQAVDEEEAEFRRRMELEERPGEDRSSPAVLPDIVDVEPVEAPQDRLPPTSREHLEAQLTELIIENGRWEPADADREAPYEPSQAAAIDPELAAEEAEAWEAMVTAYHERERAAWSGKAEDQGADGGQGTDAGSGAGQGAGSGPGSGQGSGQASGRGQAAGNGANSGGSATDGGERPPTGGAFSALEFLGGNADPETGSGAPPTAPAGAETRQEESAGSDAESERGPQEAGASADGEPAGTRGSQDTPEAAGPDSVTGESSTAEAASTGSASSPGAIDPEVLDVLFSDAPGAAEAPARESPASSREPSRDPPMTEGPPPEPSFWEWLLGLFGSDPVPEADDPPG